MIVPPTAPTSSILPPQAVELFGSRSPFDKGTQDEPPQENQHGRLNPELLKLIFTAIQNATSPALDFSNPNFFEHDIEQIIDHQNSEKHTNPDEVDELAKLVLLHKAITFKIKNDGHVLHQSPYLPAEKKENDLVGAKADASRAVASLEEIELKVELLIENYFAKQKPQVQDTLHGCKTNEENQDKECQNKEYQEQNSKANSEGKKSKEHEQASHQEKELLKELVKGEFEKNRRELALVARLQTETEAKDKSCTPKDALKNAPKLHSPDDKKPSPDTQRAEKALEHAIKSLSQASTPNPIPQKIITNIIVPYAAQESVESSQGKEKNKTQKKKKKNPKQKKRIFRKLLKKALG